MRKVNRSVSHGYVFFQEDMYFFVSCLVPELMQVPSRQALQVLGLAGMQDLPVRAWRS